MVAWASDGTLSGYDTITKAWKQSTFFFASPGSVDLNGVTRLGVFLQDTSKTNTLVATAQLTLSSGDVSANGLGSSKSFGANMYRAPVSDFPADTVPTPSQIRSAAIARGTVFRSGTSHTTAGTRTYTMVNPTSPLGLRPLQGTKYWVLVSPVIRRTATAATSDTTPSGYTVNTIGRALSVWANRSPLAPTITSPVTNSVIAPGDTFNLNYSPNADPDGFGPDTDPWYNLDLAGVEFQFRSFPTESNPDPQWMPFAWRPQSSGLGNRSWEIKGTLSVAGQDPNEWGYLRHTLGGEVLAGYDTEDFSVAAFGKGVLPNGDWQIRCRTFDFGHPYPQAARPGGKLLPSSTDGFRPDNYPSFDISPWSESIKVSVPAQVPAPLAITPRDEIAVPDDSTVRLEWQYRNTFVPPFEQDRAVVQIRKMRPGHVDAWTTIFDGVSGNNYVDLPAAFGGDTADDHEYIADGGFEAGGLDGWTTSYEPGFPPTGGAPAVANETTGGMAHSGTHYLHFTAGYSGFVVQEKHIVLRDQDDTFDISLWLVPPDDLDHLDLTLRWLDEDGNPLSPEFDYIESINKISDASWGGYQHMALTDYPRHPGARSVTISIIGCSTTFPNDVSVDLRLDDVSFIGHAGAISPFTLEVSNRYEWRVMTQDTDGQVSAFSDPARFWVVPRQNSGDVRPVVSENIDGATLGCGTHTVEIYRRGGKTKVGTIGKVSYVDWERKRDEISTAKIVVSDWDIDCGNLLSKLQTWAYEVVIWRDNEYTQERVWEGPITLLTYESDSVTINAKDVMVYPYRRIIRQKMSDAGLDPLLTVVDRARRVIQNVMAPDDPNVLAYLRVITNDDDAKQFRSTPAYSKTAYEEVDDMAANAGLDYTVAGRSIILWGTKHRIGTLPEFKDDDLGNKPIVSEYGMSMANRYAVSNGDGIYGEATRLDENGNDETYGLVEMLSSTWAQDAAPDSGTYTQQGIDTMRENFAEFSERSIADRYPPPVIVRVPDNTSLNPKTVISIQQLVPGVVIPLRSSGTLRTVVGNQKLDSMKVVENGGKETITITMSPFNRDDITAEVETV